MFKESAAPAAQFASLEAVLTGAFYHEPRVAYVLPAEAARRDVLPLFFRSVVIPATQACGEICTTPQMEGASLWISPGRFSALVQVVRTRMQALQLKLGPSSLRRWISLSSHMEKVHRQLAQDPHWYLLALGIKPSDVDQRLEDLSSVLIDPVLSRADRNHHACYVENFDEARLSFYEAHGFRIAGAGKAPGEGPSFWVLIREIGARPPGSLFFPMKRPLNRADQVLD
jgi:hypothetical protein